MSPLKRKKLSKIRLELDKLDNSLLKIIKKRTNLVKKVLAIKDKRNQIIDQKRIKIILRNIKIKNDNILKKSSVKSSIKIAKKLIINQGRILVRKSGTEAKIRIMGESNNKELLKKCIRIITKTIK